MFSALGQPLNAEIDVFPGSADEVTSLTAGLASDAIYHEQGIEKTKSQAEIALSIIKKEDGSFVLKLETLNPVSDPFLDMIIHLAWNDGSLSREYTLLLDPPAKTELSLENPVVDTPAQIKDESSIQGEQSVQESPDSANSEPTKNESVLVKKGDTLWAIANANRVSGVDLDRLLLALYQENKQAFIAKNMNLLKAGAVLSLPSEAAIGSIPSDIAKAQIQAHAADWEAYKTKLANVTMETMPAEQVENAETVGKIVTQSDEKLAPVDTQSRDVLKLSNTEAENAATEDGLKDELTAKENTMAETDEKAGALETQIEDMKKLLALKNQTMANAQRDAEATAKESQKLTLVTFMDTISPAAWKVVGALLALALIIILLRRALRLRKQAMDLGATFGHTNESVNKASSSNEHAISPELKSFDLSSIDLNFDPVVSSEKSEPPIEPLPDVFSGDFSNLIKPVHHEVAKTEAKPTTQKATKRVQKASDGSEIETKLELAVAYIDMRDKRGAKKLLNEVLKDGSEDQKSRAQALIDKLK